MFGYHITEIILYECRNLLGGDITQLQVYLVLALYRKPDGVGWIWVIAHASYTPTET